jgi:hypothetical protein
MRLAKNAGIETYFSNNCLKSGVVDIVRFVLGLKKDLVFKRNRELVANCWKREVFINNVGADDEIAVFCLQLIALKCRKISSILKKDSICSDLMTTQPRHERTLKLKCSHSCHYKIT